MPPLRMKAYTSWQTSPRSPGIWRSWASATRSRSVCGSRIHSSMVRAPHGAPSLEHRHITDGGLGRRLERRMRWTAARYLTGRIGLSDRRLRDYPVRSRGRGPSAPNVVTHSNRTEKRWTLRPWTGSWTGVPDNPSAPSAISAIFRVICAASAHSARGRSSHNPPVVGSSPTRPTGHGCYLERGHT